MERKSKEIVGRLQDVVVPMGRHRMQTAWPTGLVILLLLWTSVAGGQRGVWERSVADGMRLPLARVRTSWGTNPMNGTKCSVPDLSADWGMFFYGLPDTQKRGLRTYVRGVRDNWQWDTLTSSWEQYSHGEGTVWDWGDVVRMEWRATGHWCNTDDEYRYGDDGMLAEQRRSDCFIDDDGKRSFRQWGVDYKWDSCGRITRSAIGEITTEFPWLVYWVFGDAITYVDDSAKAVAVRLWDTLDGQALVPVTDTQLYIFTGDAPTPWGVNRGNRVKTLQMDSIGEPIAVLWESFMRWEGPEPLAEYGRRVDVSGDTSTWTWDMTRGSLDTAVWIPERREVEWHTRTQGERVDGYVQYRWRAEHETWVPQLKHISTWTDSTLAASQKTVAPTVRTTRPSLVVVRAGTAMPRNSFDLLGRPISGAMGKHVHDAGSVWSVLVTKGR